LHILLKSKREKVIELCQLHEAGTHACCISLTIWYITLHVCIYYNVIIYGWNIVNVNLLQVVLKNEKSILLYKQSNIAPILTIFSVQY